MPEIKTKLKGFSCHFNLVFFASSSRQWAENVNGFLPAYLAAGWGWVLEDANIRICSWVVIYILLYDYRLTWLKLHCILKNSLHREKQQGTFGHGGQHRNVSFIIKRRHIKLILLLVSDNNFKHPGGNVLKVHWNISKNNSKCCHHGNARIWRNGII